MPAIHHQAPSENSAVINVGSDEQLMHAALDIAQAFREGRGTWIGLDVREPADAGGIITYIPANSPIRLEFDGRLPGELLDQLRSISRGD